MIGPYEDKEEAIGDARDKARRRPAEAWCGWGDDDWAGLGPGWRVGTREELEHLRGARDIMEPGPSDSPDARGRS